MGMKAGIVYILLEFDCNYIHTWSLYYYVYFELKIKNQALCRITVSIWYNRSVPTKYKYR